MGQGTCTCKCVEIIHVPSNIVPSNIVPSNIDIRGCVIVMVAFDH